MGEDNFWEMGSTGPCGPSSEIFYDKGPEHGADGGPAYGGEERFVEIWNLVFMTYNRLPTGDLNPLPDRHIDTGAGLERILPILQKTDSVFETDVLRNLIRVGEELTRKTYGKDTENDVSLRILADHSRTFTFLLADGVVPSNEERGYVLRRIIRRAARHAQRLGVSRSVLPEMADAVATHMRVGYPEIEQRLDAIRDTLAREEHRFSTTLKVGLEMLENLLSTGTTAVDGDLAFKLHDTYGFPLDLTREIAAERGVSVDVAGFEEAMSRQRDLARAAATKDPDMDVATLYREIYERHGATQFIGYTCIESEATILTVIPSGSVELVEVFADQTPFYAEGGGQVGDTGEIRTESGRGRVIDTTAPLPGLIRHLVSIEEGEFRSGQNVLLRVDRERRDAIRRSHTATHLLQWALRSVLGTQVIQQGSRVEADELRFDFNHHSPINSAELRHVENLVMGEVLSSKPLQVSKMSRAEAASAGALAFFGEKYGEDVRVIRAGDQSVELCGGTHVESLGQIGTFMIRGEFSVGSNLRRIEALTGWKALEEGRRIASLLQSAAKKLKIGVEEIPDAVKRLMDLQKDTVRKYDRLQAKYDHFLAAELAGQAVNGVVVARADDRDQAALRSLALAILERPDINSVGLIGTPDGNSVVIVVALEEGVGDAGVVARVTGQVVGGGGGGKDPCLGIAGGRDVTRINEAIDVLWSRLKL